jgi:hypothetical protein
MRDMAGSAAAQVANWRNLWRVIFMASSHEFARVARMKRVYAGQHLSYSAAAP